MTAHSGHAAVPALLQATAREQAPLAGGSGPAKGEARLSVTILDAKTGAPTPVRVRLTDESGRPVGYAAPPRTPAAPAARLAVPGSVIGLPIEAIGVLYGQNDSAQG